MTATIFDYWLSEHQYAYNWVLNKLRVEGADGVIDGDTVTFTATSDNPAPLADFLDGRTYHYLNWVEVGATLDNPAPEEVVAPKRGRKKKVDVVDVPEKNGTDAEVVVNISPVEEIVIKPELIEPAQPTETVVEPVEPTPAPVVTPSGPKTIMDFDVNKDGKLEPEEIKAYTDYITKK